MTLLITPKIDALFVDLDDTLVSSAGNIISDTMSLIRVCKSKSIPIHVVTRNEDVKIILEELNIIRFFDSIHFVDMNRKSEVITSKFPVFIDDSEFERKEVKESLPTTRVLSIIEVSGFTKDLIEGRVMPVGKSFL